jgi:SAM-dependent methyltransferase
MDNYFDENPYDITKRMLDDPESVCAHIHQLKINTISDFLDIKAESTILDCGCGTGFASLFFPFSKQYKFFSIDISNVEILQAKKYSKPMNNETEWLVGDACHLPFRDNSFDAAFCIALLHHIDKYQDLINELVRVAGKIVVCEPNKFCPMQWLYQRSKTAKLAGDTKAFSVNQLKEDLRDAGLHNIQWKRINLIPETTAKEKLNHWKKIEDYLLWCYLTNILAGTIVIYGEK